MNRARLFVAAGSLFVSLSLCYPMGAVASDAGDLTVRLSTLDTTKYPSVMRLQPVPNAIMGTSGDVFLESPSPFTTVGVLLQAHTGSIAA